MENPIIEELQQEQEQETTEQKIDSIFFKFKWALAIFFLCCFLALLLFGWKQNFTTEGPIQHDVFGTYGDFIGGFLGTVVALYSVYLLVRTLQSQLEMNADGEKTNRSVIEANNSVIETNKKLLSLTSQQIFDSNFSKLLDLYKDAINAYEIGDKKGRSAFEKIVDDFKNKGLTNKTEYKRRSIGADSEYASLYVKYKHFFSVHFRMLYLLVKLTAEEKIDEHYRVSYAKIIRGQLSENELLILRYNCFQPYGIKMQYYVNQYNLTKHLPIMSLLEFTQWRNILQDNNLYSSIDQLYLTLRKIMTGMLYDNGESAKEHKISPRIGFNIFLNELHDTFKVVFNFNKKKKKGGAIKRPIEENTFDKIPQEELCDFFEEFFIEMFVYSNFCLFNGDDHKIVSAKKTIDYQNELQITTTISRPNRKLVLAQRQVVPE